ncbi:sensor histidine kinase [Actinomadura violacea]|uniref:histidine kinase n=1 Tax=Actinomadura violacea TaxID=2819934 RepID=A0ABS3RNB0_9ACTN|nr:sensor histidine kinase [Actinomadura violacea]MBO2458043.1 sensor domain-containing protein [Actinomadura violacea]
MSEVSLASPPATRPSSAPARFGRELVYLLSGLPVGAAAFAVAIAGLAAGASTLVVLLGLPILVGTLTAARAFARLERRQAERATGRDLPPHHYRDAGETGFAGWLRALREPQSWRDLVHMVVAFPVRLITFCVAITWTVGGAAETVYAAWSWPIPRDADNTGVLDLAFGISSRGADIAFNTGVGVVLLATAVPVVHGLAALQTALARALLTNQTAALQARAAQLAAGRRSAVAAEAHTLRRLERDLHDGPQQRLVRLNMDLETVARRLDDDPERARPLVEDMIEQSREALSEVRALSRGIAPPILADRGLAAALSAAAGRCPVPVSLEVDLASRRYAAIAENTVYFVVTEALANIAKHAQATRCSVAVTSGGAALHVRVEDDGRGGAHPGKGHGLVGLADRLAAVEGTLDITSPPGGPTVLTAAVPLTDD